MPALSHPITVGVLSHGLRTAAYGDPPWYRIVAYRGGGYCPQQYVIGLGWLLLSPEDALPEVIERALCSALDIPYHP